MQELGKKIIAAAVITGLAVFGILGCGSSDSSSSSSTVSASLTKAQFIKAGSKICQERLEEKDELLKTAMAEIPSSEAGEPSKGTLTHLGESILPPVQELIAELSELSGSSNSEAAAEKITRDLEAGLKKAEADPSILIQTDPFTKGGKSAKAYGMTACAL